jgi:PHP family Zn ribbon phosphoesterase
MFKTEAKTNPSGAYDVQTTCSKGHTSFKKRGDSNQYKCPYCGLDVP